MNEDINETTDANVTSANGSQLSTQTTLNSQSPPAPSLTVSPPPSPAPQFIKTPDVYSRQGELLTPEHPDYPAILAIITRELSERFQNGETALAHYFASPSASTSCPPVDPPALAPAPPAEVSPSPSLTV